MTRFQQAVLDGIELLRSLPREREQTGEARARFAAFQKANPDIHAELVTDWSTASAHVSYDLLLRDEGHGTLALSHAALPQSPWNVEHAEHWTAQRVLTIDGQALSVHDALRIWQARAAAQPTLMDELLDEAILARAVAEYETDVSDAEAQRAADAIRRRLGLHDSARTMRWLQEHGLSLTGFEELARREAKQQKFLLHLQAQGLSLRAFLDRARESADIRWHWL